MTEIGLKDGTNDTRITNLVRVNLPGIQKMLVDKGILKQTPQGLAAMLTELYKAGCTRPTIEALCVRGKFVNLEDLIRANCGVGTYRELGIEFDQQHLLSKFVQQRRESQKSLARKLASKPAAMDILVEVCAKAMQQQHCPSIVRTSHA